MTRLHKIVNTYYVANRTECWLFLFGLAYALYWQAVSPMQYTADSITYLSAAHMLAGKTAVGMPPIFRPPGYPLMLLFTGAVVPGMFSLTLWVQALLAAMIPVLVYRIVRPYGAWAAVLCGALVVLTGTTTVHTSQIITEPLFTLLLFLGLYLSIILVRDIHTSGKLLYGLAFTFALLNMVKSIAWPIYWAIWLVVIWVGWRDGCLRKLRKAIVGSALSFMAMMLLWVVADDILFSNGNRYSPLVPIAVGADSYFYDIPFNEAYFVPWSKRVAYVEQDSDIFGTLEGRPAMTKVREIVVERLTHHPEEITGKHSPYPSHLFVPYLDQPEVLADRIFAFPNYAYANYVRAALTLSVTPEEKESLYYAAAKEAGRHWPRRWLTLFADAPLSLLTGPSRGGGAQKFLLAYTSLRHYIEDPEAAGYRSLVNHQNGPATRLLLTTLTDALRNNPELWRGTEGLFGTYLDKPEQLVEAMLATPNQAHAWDITVMLWGLMGYEPMSKLLDQVASETYASHLGPLVLRMWDSTLAVAAGPGFIQFDHLGPQFGEVQIYAYMESLQLSERQKEELRATRHRHDDPTVKRLQAPVKAGYFLFYLLKPLLLITCIAAMAVLWSRRQPVVPAMIVMLPYGASVAIYGMLVTALPRYTDSTLIIPLIITCMALPECLQILKERRRNV